MRKYMFTRVAATWCLLMLCILLLLSACGGGGGSSSPSQPSQPQPSNGGYSIITLLDQFLAGR